MVNEKTKSITSYKISHSFLKAIQLTDITAEILTPPHAAQQRLSFTTLNLTVDENAPQNRTYTKLFSTNKLNWYGNLWFTGNVPFTAIRKTKTFKDEVQNLGRTTFILNSINANPPTELGFFIHHAVRHDTSNFRPL